MTFIANDIAPRVVGLTDTNGHVSTLVVERTWVLPGQLLVLETVMEQGIYYMLNTIILQNINKRWHNFYIFLSFWLKKSWNSFLMEIWLKGNIKKNMWAHIYVSYLIFMWTREGTLDAMSLCFADTSLPYLLGRPSLLHAVRASTIQ